MLKRTVYANFPLPPSEMIPRSKLLSCKLQMRGGGRPGNEAEKIGCTERTSSNDSALIFSPLPQVLKYTAGHINYGGRVTDDWDRRCIMNILNDFYCPEVLSSEYKFSESGIYHQLTPESNHNVGESRVCWRGGEGRGTRHQIRLGSRGTSFG